MKTAVFVISGLVWMTSSPLSRGDDGVQVLDDLIVRFVVARSGKNIRSCIITFNKKKPQFDYRRYEFLQITTR